MSIIFESNMKGYNAALNSLADALYARGELSDSVQFVKDEGKRLAIQCQQFTAPLGPGGSTKNGAAKKAGEQAVTNQVNKMFTEIGDELLSAVVATAGTDNVDRRWITTDSGERERLRWDKVIPDGNMAAMREQHFKLRDKHGRFRRTKKERIGVWPAFVVVPKGSIAPFLRKKLRNVGRAKATWNRAITEMGGKVPSYTKKHASAVSEKSIYRPSFSNPQKPSVEFGSTGPGVADNLKSSRAFRDALRRRAEKMLRRIKLMMSGYNKDLKAKMRARFQAKATQEPEPNNT